MQLPPSYEDTSPVFKLIRVRRRLDRLSRLLDESVPVPFTGFKFGVDAIIGLVPVVGDLLGALLSLIFIGHGIYLKMPTTTLMRMGFNILLELVLGSVPIVGDVIDIVWKSNRRNYLLIDAYITDQLAELDYDEEQVARLEESAKGRGLALFIVITLVIFFLLLSLADLPLPLYMENMMAMINQHIVAPVRELLAH